MKSEINIEKYPNKPVHIPWGQNKYGTLIKIIGDRHLGGVNICNYCKYCGPDACLPITDSNSLCSVLIGTDKYYK